MTYTAFGPVADDVIDPDQLAADVADLLGDLLTSTGQPLAQVANRSLAADLRLSDDVLFDQLRVLSYTAGAPELPCCEGDDDAAVAAWADAVLAIARTGRLPG